ncbi:aldo/keto reductase [Streptomyces sp. NPDC058369]|uniref:aldo/keto reductase n=1 Tax=unclassified Streptomyces TaxID=2593676 RepID=UPI0022586561|nr:aldo/keto reductase [Streptomyces sp. NBC_01789]MCX4448720.1 aldo/keto reductase [Streptomyces sp. NBC_01789]
MRHRTIGNLTVGAIGLGAMPLSIEGRPDEQRATATVHAALDAGVTLIDTADSYHWHAGERGHNELLLARALRNHGGDTSGVLVATKGGRGRPGDGSWTVTGTPGHLRRAAEESAARLGVEAIGLYQLHKPDPTVPWADSVGALRDLLDAGTIRAAGISNVSTGRIREAHAILGDALVSVQNQYSPAVRDSEPELRLCERLGLAFLPWSPLGGISRSALDGPSGPASAGTAFHRVADARGVSPQQVVLAWLLARSPVMVPVPGASRPASVQDSARAAGLVLDEAETALLDEDVDRLSPSPAGAPARGGPPRR